MVSHLTSTPLIRSGCVVIYHYLPAFMPTPTLPRLSDFSRPGAAEGWEIENDVVMGGESSSRMKITKNGNLKFWGKVSLANDGGFASVQHYFDEVAISQYSKIRFHVKGDGKDYQLMLKAHRHEKPQYIHGFTTKKKEWQTVELSLGAFYPVFHGERMDLPNFDGQTLAGTRFFIGNGKAEKFKLLVKWIELA